jgi:site-specific recombinase XerD
MSALRIAGVTKSVSVYDFKHSMISGLANSGANLAGLAHLVGHKHLATTARYVQTGERAAEEVFGLRVPNVPKHGSMRPNTALSNDVGT